jgi:hypothetical protein
MTENTTRSQNTTKRTSRGAPRRAPMTENTTRLEPLTIDALRAIMSDEIRRLRDGETTAASANAVSNAAGKILSTVKLEMEYARLTGRKPLIAMLDAGTDPETK